MAFTTRIQTVTRMRRRGSFLRSCDSSARNGMANIVKPTNVANAFQKPSVRSRYHVISCGKLAGQMIINCDTDRYVQKIVKAKSILPRSCKMGALTRLWKRSPRDVTMSEKTDRARVAWTLANKTIPPKTVE